jgi:predicted TIM-barrel fold metal-dependent hydrolase
VISASSSLQLLAADEVEGAAIAEGLAACLAAAGPGWIGSLQLPVEQLDDREGAALPSGLPEVIDGHVHLFPDPVFAAVWRWFEAHAWKIRYQLKAPDALHFLLDKGLTHVTALHYAHKPGMARALNAYIAALCAAEPRLIGLATVLPGEPEAALILEEAFAAGLQGVKLHCHVQCFAPDAPELREVYEACVRHGKPLVMHAGREPAVSQYRCDPHQLCAVERIERVLLDHPRLKLCVPHLGADEFDGYERLLERHDRLWLDTTMVAADFFPAPTPVRLIRARPGRVLYGTDFPILPYAWDRELHRLLGLKLPPDELEQLLSGAARALFAAPPRPGL